MISYLRAPSGSSEERNLQDQLSRDPLYVAGLLLTGVMAGGLGFWSAHKLTSGLGDIKLWGAIAGCFVGSLFVAYIFVFFGLIALMYVTFVPLEWLIDQAFLKTSMILKNRQLTSILLLLSLCTFVIAMTLELAAA